MLTGQEAPYDCRCHKRWLASGLQDNSWQVREQLGEGCNGSVMATNSLLYPGVVLKRGSGTTIKAEAERLWQLRHPSVVQVYAVLYSDEVTDEGWCVQYMALARLVASLQSMLEDSNKRCRSLLMCCMSLAPRAFPNKGPAVLFWNVDPFVVNVFTCKQGFQQDHRTGSC